jgi:hypothetical protein
MASQMHQLGGMTPADAHPPVEDAKAVLAKKMYTDMVNGIRNVRDSLTLLELSVAGLNTNDSVPFDDVYALGFYGRSTLYNIGYVISKAISDNDGAQGLAAYLKRPGYEFALHYAKLPKYGADADHPKLGPNTIAQLARLSNGCK